MSLADPHTSLSTLQNLLTPNTIAMSYDAISLFNLHRLFVRLTFLYGSHDTYLCLTSDLKKKIKT
jgi:hypothetical protein